MTKTPNHTTPVTTPANTPDQPAAGKGMPAKSPQPQTQRSRPGQPESAKDRSMEDGLELPHDRDEAADMTSGQTSRLMEQAAQDMKDGLKDTSKQPEMNQAYKKQR